MKKLNNTAKLAFYNARSRRGDDMTISEKTGYSRPHITNVRNGKVSINDTLANAFYNISRRRVKNSDMA